MNEDFLSQLQEAKSDDERNWLITKNLLDSLPEDLAQMAYAAAVPHWFDAKILAALRPELKDKAETLYTDLQRLPFIEPYTGRGHNVHELTRKLMLDYLWVEKRKDFIKTSRRAAEYFKKTRYGGGAWIIRMYLQRHPLNLDASLYKMVVGFLLPFSFLQKTTLESFPVLNSNYQIEYIYHLAIVDPKLIAKIFPQQISALNLSRWIDNQFQNMQSPAAFKLVTNLKEHTVANRVEGPLSGWIDYWQVILSSETLKPSESAENLGSILLHGYQDNGLTACLLVSLGDEHTNLNNISKANKLYEKALRIYKQEKDIGGEIKCTIKLCDNLVKEKQSTLAISTLENSLSQVSSKMFDPLSKILEIQIISAIAKNYSRIKQHNISLEKYNLALNLILEPTFRSIILLEQIDVFLKLKDVDSANNELNNVTKVLPITHPLVAYRYGVLNILLRKYDNALGHFNKILEHFPKSSYGYFGIGVTNLLMGNITPAIESYKRGLSFNYKYSDVDEIIDYLENLKMEQPELKGIDDVLVILREWSPS